MTRAAIAAIALPILRELVGESAKLFLNPCVRLTWWRLRQHKLAAAYRWTGFADWRVSVLAEQCRNLKSGDCTALEAADEVWKQLEALAQKRRERR